MSTMLLSFATVNGLLSFARYNYRRTDSLTFKLPADLSYGPFVFSELADVQAINDDQLTKLGRRLIRCNLADHAESYGGRYEDERAEYDPERYTFHFDGIAASQEIGWIAKQVECVRYNSKIEPGSPEDQWLRWVLNLAIHILPSYKAAPWGYDG